MTIADLVYRQVKLLPDSLAREVLDFVSYLREGRDRAEWRDLMNAQATGLAAVWDNPEDRVWMMFERGACRENPRLTTHTPRRWRIKRLS